MNYSFRWYPNIKATEADEVIYTQIPTVKQYKESNRKNKTVLDVRGLDDKFDFWVNKINHLCAEVGSEQISVLLSEYQLAEARNLETAFFLDYHVNSWDKLEYVKNLGVSQVYITDELLFDIVRVKLYCKLNNIKVRVFPNVAQLSANADENDMYPIISAFVRPEDVERYSSYVDVFEFWGDETRQSVLKRIYSKGEWAGKLDDIIIGLNTGIQNDAIPPQFGRIRTECLKRCYVKSCNLCKQCIDVAKTLEEQKIGFKNEH